ncbi:MAG: universal stress protein [Methanotrichaceae archaeon]|nr:universal stress protein [Methanotrichaceae archaeon]
MFRRILVPTDFSKYSQKVLECIKEIPGLEDILLLHVIGPFDSISKILDPVARDEEAKAKLAEERTYLERFGLNVEARIEKLTEGEIAGLIQRVADEEHIPLIALGARGKGLVEGILLGNVARTLLRYGNTNLLLMRYALLEGREGPKLGGFCSKPFSRVLCPTDFSEPAAQTVRFIEGIEGVKEVILQHVIFKGETWKEIEASREDAAEKLEAIGGEIRRSGLEFRAFVSVGNPVEEICNLANKEDVSLIAMSSHGMGWLKQLAIGSTTYDVARTAELPLMVVRARPIA